MTRFFQHMRLACARFRKEDGTATVEFVILFPIVFTMFLMGVEAGYVMLQRVSLERALDLTLREVRLGNADDWSHDGARSQVCRHRLLGSCEDRLMLEMREIDRTTWAFPADDAPCLDLGSPTPPSTNFSTGSDQSIMFIRACYLVRPIFPTTNYGLRLPLDASGMFALRATAGFIRE